MNFCGNNSIYHNNMQLYHDTHTHTFLFLESVVPVFGMGYLQVHQNWKLTPPRNDLTTGANSNRPSAVSTGT
jgi:hypothetical protein